MAETITFPEAEKGMFWRQVSWLCDEDKEEYNHFSTLLRFVRAEKWPKKWRRKRDREKIYGRDKNTA